MSTRTLSYTYDRQIVERLLGAQRVQYRLGLKQFLPIVCNNIVQYYSKLGERIMIKILVDGNIVLNERLSVGVMQFIMQCFKNATHFCKTSETIQKHYHSFSFVCLKDGEQYRKGDSCTVAIFHRDINN